MSKKQKSLSEMSTEEIAELPRETYINMCVKDYFANPTPPVNFKHGKPVYHNEKDVNAAIVQVKKGLRKV